jgi:hypothetical protein
MQIPSGELATPRHPGGEGDFGRDDDAATIGITTELT